MKILKKKNKIIIEIPFLTDRWNPWMEKGSAGEHKTLIGIIRNDDWGNQETGFAYVIDMDYKGKGDQETDIQIYTEWMEKKDFIKLCNELDIECIEEPICAYCNKTIYGCFTLGDKGNMCDDCIYKDKGRIESNIKEKL